MGCCSHHVQLLLTLVLIISVLATTSTAQSGTFTCNSSSATTCRALIDYVSPNTTTISAIKTLFGVKNLRSILGANNYLLSTSPNFTVTAKQTIKIPFQCACKNGTGSSSKHPVYIVKAGDGLDHIAVDIFSRLVTYQQIAAANNISNPDLVEVGQELYIPLPCSCDDVDNSKVIHYGHVVKEGSSVASIAQEFGTTQDTLLRINGMTDPKDLKASAVLDVPLKACASSVGNNSLDYPLLVSNGTYVFTANNCVMCSCDSANNWTLQCNPSQLKASNRSICPSMQCQGTTLDLGNITTASNGCNRTCAYAGYANQTIFTTLAQESTCPASNVDSPNSGNNTLRVGLQGFSWSILFISLQLVALCRHLL